MLNTVSVSNVTPDIFHPFTLRSGTKYRALGDHVFTIEEKIYVCQLFINNYRHFAVEENTRNFCTRHNIRIEDVDVWINAYQNGIIF